MLKLRQFAVVILVLIVSLQPMSKMWIYVSFKINQEKISRVLCEQKELKNNTCHGKCHLKKQLEKAEQNEKKQFPLNHQEVFELLYNHQHDLHDFQWNNISIERETLKPFVVDFYSFSLAADIFHPPRPNLI